MASGRKDRTARLTETRAGWWASCSQDYLRLAVDLYGLSSAYAKKFDGNVSLYPIAGIPLLISTVRALLIEANSGIYGIGEDAKSMARLAKDQNEIGLISEKYVGGILTLLSISRCYMKSATKLSTPRIRQPEQRITHLRICCR